MKTREDTAPFDAAAESYDATFDALPGAARVRGIVHNILARLFPPGGTIVELNCGTGTDAVFLARRGLCVHATDASPAMVAQARAKAGAYGVTHLVTHQVLDFASVASLSGRLFDGVLSDFGGLNCLRDLRPLFHDLAGIVRPGGHAVLCFMPRFSLWETVAFAVRGDIARTKRRRAPDGAAAPIAGGTVRTYYHSPRELVSAAAPWFRHVSTTGLNVLTPPPSSVAAARLLRPVLPALEWLDDHLASLPPLNRMGDHVVVVLQRTP